MAANYAARALLAVGHDAKLKAMWQQAPADAELAYLYLRALAAQGHARTATASPAFPDMQHALASITPQPQGAEFLALAAVAKYLAAGGRHGAGDASALESASAELKATLADPNREGNAKLRVVCGEFFLATGQLGDAHAACAALARAGDADAAAVLAHVLIKLDRPLLALDVAAHAARTADDAVTPAALECVCQLAVGGDARLKDARAGVEELVQTYAATPKLLCLLAAAHLLQGNAAEAARLYGEAATMDASYAEACVGVVVAGAAAGRADLNQISAMWTHFPNHAFTANLAEKAMAFDRAAEKYATPSA